MAQTIRRIAALALVAVLSLGANKPPLRNWNTTITANPDGSHRIGNGEAQIKLVSFVSYTCPHCATFERQADSALRVGYIATGKVSHEIHNYVRDPVDLAVALLTNCGPAAKFPLNHTAFMRAQDRWITPFSTAGQLARQRWFHPDFKTRMRHIATDFHFYDIIATRGYTRQQADQCLTDEVMAARLADQTKAADALGVNSTPSFLINDILLTGTHDWRNLEPQIKARL